jgi:type 1 glutamine amidotransferase
VAEALGKIGFNVDVSGTLEAYADLEKLNGYHVIVPCWTMGEIKGDLVKNLSEAVKDGTGLAGWHGGMCDSFRQNTDYQFMTGGQWVAHPGGIVKYRVNITDHEHPITKGLEDFEIESEQYYLHVDPAVKVLATTSLAPERVMGNTGPGGGDVVMPVTWTKMWGKGRVSYTSLGHVAKDFSIPQVIEMVTRGCKWAAREE